MLTEVCFHSCTDHICAMTNLLTFSDRNSTSESAVEFLFHIDLLLLVPLIYIYFSHAKTLVLLMIFIRHNYL